jgi:hypothetical protein
MYLDTILSNHLIIYNWQYVYHTRSSAIAEEKPKTELKRNVHDCCLILRVKTYIVGWYVYKQLFAEGEVIIGE